MVEHSSGRDGASTRRRFVGRAAVAVAGGVVAGCPAARALAAPEIPEVRLPPARSGLPRRQFAWAEHLRHDEYDNPIAPRHDRLLLFDVRGPATPARARLLEARLRRLEHAFPWSHDGLLFTVGWGCPSYFSRLGLPSPVPRAGRLSTFEHPAIDRFDMCLHLAGDDSQQLADIEAALVHGAPLDGVPHAMALSAAFVWRATRSGFTGPGLPAAHQDARGIPRGHPVPATAPLFMGFQSALRRNLASEDAVAIPAGPFAQGTTMHVSYLREKLGAWYGRASEQDRVARMYSPQTSVAAAARLTDDARSEPHEIVEAMRRHGVIGHAQATAQARRGGRPRLLRRDFNTVDDGYAGLHFVSLQRSYDDFVVTRNAMNANGAHLVNRRITATQNNGINAFIDVRRRANYILPSRAQRSFPLLPGRDAALR